MGVGLMPMLQLFRKTSTRNSGKLVIGLCSSDAATRKRFKGIIPSEDQGVEFVDIPKGSGQSLPVGVNVVVYDLDIQSEESIGTFNTFMADCPRSVPVVVLTAQITDEMARWASSTLAPKDRRHQSIFNTAGTRRFSLQTAVDWSPRKI